MREAANWHFDAHRFPTHMGHEPFEHHLERDAVERVQWTSSSHFIFSENLRCDQPGNPRTDHSPVAIPRFYFELQSIGQPNQIPARTMTNRTFRCRKAGGPVFWRAAETKLPTLSLPPGNHWGSTTLKDADLGQFCLRSRTCPRSDSLGRAISQVNLILPLAFRRGIAIAFRNTVQNILEKNV